jgi:serine/threonine-protein kinase
MPGFRYGVFPARFWPNMGTVNTPFSGKLASRHEWVRAQSDPGSIRISYHSLAAELVDRNHVQLSWIAGAAIVSILSIAFLARSLQPEVAVSHELPIVRWAMGLSLLLSAGLITVERFGWLKPIVLLRAGLIYQVLVAAALSIFENSIRWHADEFVRGTSSITVWLIAFALLVPAAPLSAAVFSLASAAMGPLGHYVMTQALHLPQAPRNRLLIYYLPCFLMSAISALINLRILRLEWVASRARERGSYELLQLLSRGGMGEVWRARHRLLKRDAAVKLIRPDVLVAQPGRQAEMLRKRFEQEARSIAALKSPHTVAVYDFGATEDGGFYYAMELLEGFDLDKLVRRFGPLPAARVVHILRQACGSLEEAHFHSMIHRDIKPTNLFLCRLGTTYDFCKLLDFGLVKRCISGDAALLSAAGNATGTPAFMAPEVATSKSIDGRADLYGLGCVAYWLLSGCLVFDEPTPTATVIAHVQKEPVPPSQRTEIELPAGLEQIVMACLEKDPSRRPESAAVLNRMLAGCASVRPWRHEDAEAWWRINAPEAVSIEAATTAAKSAL